MTALNGDVTKWRLFAAAVDNLLASGICALIAARIPGELTTVARGVFAAIGYLAYFLIQEGLWHTTLGKRAFGLVLTRLDDRPVGWSAAWWRTVLRVIEVNPLLFGALPAVLTAIWSKRKQRLGDMLAGTVVVRLKALNAEAGARA